MLSILSLYQTLHCIKTNKLKQNNIGKYYLLSLSGCIFPPYIGNTGVGAKHCTIPPTWDHFLEFSREVQQCMMGLITLFDTLFLSFGPMGVSYRVFHADSKYGFKSFVSRTVF